MAAILKKIDLERIEIVDIDGSEHWVRRAGLLYSYAHNLPETLLHDAAKIPDFGRVGLKRPKAIMDRVIAMNKAFETRYDAGHGRRYFLCVYDGNPLTGERMRQRRIVLAAADGITNLRQHHIDAGIPASDLDAMAKRVT